MFRAPSRWIPALVLCGWGLTARAQSAPETVPGPAPVPAAPRPGGDFADLSLDDLLSEGIRITTRHETSLRDSPGVVTVVTGDEIRRAGARDMIDVLQLVPGFQLGVDQWNEVSVGVRGVWGLEGKVLLLVDGVEYNEILYSTIELGSRFPVAAIDRVEIIRGPGSVTYGGYAELAVVNIITRSGAQVDGVRATGMYSQAGRTLGSRSATLSAGKKTGDLDVALHVLAAEGNRSDRTYTDIGATSYDLGDGNARLRTVSSNLGVRYRGLELRLIGEDYSNTHRDGYDYALDQAITTPSRSYFADLKYAWAAADGLTLTPRVGYKRFRPWHSSVVLVEADGSENADFYYGTEAERYSAGLTGDIDPAALLGTTWGVAPRLSLGVEYYRDRALLPANLPAGQYEDRVAAGQRSWHYDNVGAFAQAVAATPLANVSAGVRYDARLAGTGGGVDSSSLVPRLGLTRVLGDFHVKALFSQAFRAPGIENMELGDGIRPEKTTVWELELGYRVSEALFIVGNLFDITIRDPIVYSYDDSDPASPVERYVNAERTGTSGAELEARFKHRHHMLDVSYSYYTRRRFLFGDEGASSARYLVSPQSDALLGFAQHKVALGGSWEVTPGLSLDVTAVVYGPKQAYASEDAAGNLVLRELGPTFLLDLNVLYQDVVPGLDAMLGVHSLFDQESPYAQPYDSGHAPMPALGRAVMARLDYHLPF